MSDAHHTKVETFFAGGVGERLVARVIRLEGLTKRKSEAAFNAYKQFFELKLEVEDFDATKLSPPLMVDTVWHLDVLDTKTYADRCIRAFGRVVHHDVDGDLRGRDARVVATKRALRARFGADFDETMWLWAGESECDVLHPVKVVKREAEDDEAASTAESKKMKAEPVAPVAPPIQIRIRDQAGMEAFYKIKKTTPLGSLFNVHAQREGVCPGTLRYLFDGMRRYAHQTAADIGMEDGDQIDVLSEQGGC